MTYKRNKNCLVKVKFTVSGKKPQINYNSTKKLF